MCNPIIVGRDSNSLHRCTLFIVTITTPLLLLLPPSLSSPSLQGRTLWKKNNRKNTRKTCFEIYTCPEKLLLNTCKSVKENSLGKHYIHFGNFVLKILFQKFQKVCFGKFSEHVFFKSLSHKVKWSF